MIPEHIIKLAIEGGYERERYYFDENGNWDYVPESDVLNPLFWQALGKACGWTGYNESENKEIGWNGYAINFFTLLMASGDTLKFWDSITSINKTI